MGLAGDRIREMRLQNDMTLDEVAKSLGINRQAVYKYEHGIVTNIPLENLEKMAALFGTTPEYLSGWSDNDPVVESDAPVTSEARILAKGIDKLPAEEREQALSVVRAMFAKYSDYFSDMEDNDGTGL